MLFNRKKKQENETKQSNDYLEIEFVAKKDIFLETCQPPQPAKVLMPDWYKNIPTHHTKVPHFIDEVGNNNSSLKQCMPFFDSLVTGYIMTTPCDIIVEKNFDGSSVKISTHPMFDLIGDRGTANMHSMPIPPDYYQTEFTWQTIYEAKTPPGYSCLYTHPINRPDLPFHTVSGVMDTDQWYLTGNHPFIVKKGFEGIIPMGTPMMSIIPFKRDNWKSSSRALRPMEEDILQSRVRRHAAGGYKKEIWTRKDFI